MTRHKFNINYGLVGFWHPNEKPFPPCDCPKSHFQKRFYTRRYANRAQHARGLASPPQRRAALRRLAGPEHAAFD